MCDHKFGIRPEGDDVNADAPWWGARAIFEGDGRGGHDFSLVWDRQQCTGGEEGDPARTALEKWINAKGLPALRKEIKRLRLTPSTSRFATRRRATSWSPIRVPRTAICTSARHHCIGSPGTNEPCGASKGGVDRRVDQGPLLRIGRSRLRALRSAADAATTTSRNRAWRPDDTIARPSRAVFDCSIGKTMKPSDIRAGRCYVIDAGVGRKLIRVVRVGFVSVKLQKLRAASARWTLPTAMRFETLTALNLRETTAADRDLLAAARRADAAVYTR